MIDHMHTEMYIGFLYENLYIRFTSILKYIVSLSAFVSLFATLKHCFCC